MRLDFNVLWVEDQVNNVQAQKERIELLIGKEGFRLRVEFASSVDQAKRFLSDDIYGDHIDLVLMDYDLGAGQRGDDGLVEVRNIFPYKDLVFYSSQAPNLLEKVQNKKVQGVFCSTRDDLPNTVEGVFEALVKKVLDIDHSRGIVMGATSDIDGFVNDCMSSLFEKIGEREQKKILTLILKRLKEKQKDFEKSAAMIEAIKHIGELSAHHQIYTSADRLRLLVKLSEVNSVDPASIELIKKYLIDILPKRNKLAHVSVQINGFLRKLVDQKGVELTAEDMRSLRRELLDSQNFFETLARGSTGAVSTLTE